MSRASFSDDPGYSLVEVLTAIVILSIAIIPMVTMFDTGLRSATTSGNYDKARALANTNLERIKSMDLAAVQAQSTCPVQPQLGSGLTCKPPTKSFVKINSGTFVSGNASDGMMRVTIEVTWSGKSYSATGLVTQ